jgi:HEAT repeat protein
LSEDKLKFILKEFRIGTINQFRSRAVMVHVFSLRRGDFLMLRWWMALGLMILSLTAGAPARASIEDEEPVVQGRKLSEWVTMLKTDKDENRRRASLIAIKIIATKLETAKTVAPVLAAAREDASDRVRKAATQTLGDMALSARDYLKRLDREKKKGEIADATLKQALDALTDKLRDDKSADVRQTAAESLGRLGTDGRSATDALTTALKDKTEAVRAAAAEALGRIGPDAKSAAPALVETLRDTKAERSVRLFAAYALGRIDPAPPNLAVAALGEVLQDTGTPGEVRKATADSLGLLGKAAEDAVPALAEALVDAKNVELRRAAAVALEQIGPPAVKALPKLRQATHDEDKFVRGHAAHALSAIGKDAADAIPDLVRLVKDDAVTDVRVAAAEALGIVGVRTPDAVDALTTASRSSQTVLREAAAEALKKLEEKQ